MEKTENFNLNKPTPEDFYNIEDTNDNMDIIDTEIKIAQDKAEMAFTQADNGIGKIKNSIGVLSALATTDKTSLVNAINENTSQLAEITPELISGKTIYVDVNTGSDTMGTGESTSPYKTITKALSTIKKTLYVDVKIRVLPGDYTTEGNINITNFSKGYITITAFDGTNDVNIPNDDYKVYKFYVGNCDQVVISGIRIMYDGVEDYGIFTTGVRNAHYIGLKNVEGNLINNGFGVTQNSNLMLENCLISNKDTVVSCNNRSTVLAKDFAVGSTNNRIGLWAHGGATIIYSGAQAITTEFSVFKDAGGIIVNEVGVVESKGSNKIQVDQTVTDSPDTITIPISLDSAPTEIQIHAIIDDGKSFSIGSWVNGVSSSIARRHAGIMCKNSNTIVELDDGTDAYNIYSISSVSKGQIILTRNTEYTAMSSKTMKLRVVCSY